MPHARSARVPSRLAVVVALVVVALTAVSGLSSPAHAQGSAYWVAETGSDTNAGTEAAPFRTLQRALDLAAAGTTINLKPGTYREAVITKRPGTAAAPIKIKGPDGPGERSHRRRCSTGSAGACSASTTATTPSRASRSTGSRTSPAREYPDKTLSQVRAYKDSVQARAVNSKLVYVGASNDHAPTSSARRSRTCSSPGRAASASASATGPRNSLVVNSVIQWCGMLGLGVEPDQYKYHNAEGVYIGTSPKSTTQPMYANDTSNNIVVRDSTINTFGSECFEVKENAHHNRMENVDCGYNDEPLAQQGSNVELRGDHNTVLRSRLYESRSWNMKLASDTAADDLGGNTAQITDFKRAAAPAIVNRQTGSGPFCSDTFDGTVSEGNSIGSPTAACAGVDTSAPTVTARTPAASATGVAVGEQRHRDVLRGRAAGQRHDVHPQDRFDRGRRGGDLRRHEPDCDPEPDGRPGREHPVHGHADRWRLGHPGHGRQRAGDRSWTFTTAAAADTTAPTVTARNPAANATAIAVGSNVTATFSEPVQGVSGSTVKLRADGALSDVAAAVTYNATSRLATLDPSANLAPNTQYTATLTGGASGIRDAAGNPVTDAPWSFTTAAGDTTAPTVTARTPSNNATGVRRAANITATFSEPVSGVSRTTVTLRNASGNTVSASVSYNATTRVVTIDPDSTLSSSTQYTVTLTGGTSAIRDAAGNALGAVPWTFRTGTSW